MATNRKPYVREIQSNWWHKKPFYSFYMLRELTAVPAVWFSFLLIYGLAALAKGPANWAAFVSFLSNPIVLLINLVALMAALLHTKTWFELAPKAACITESKEHRIKLGLWIITILATIILLCLAF
jgi:fumarate reductase subunit C